MLVLAWMCEIKFCDGMTMLGLEHSKGDLCMFRKVCDGVSEIVDVCHVENSFARAKDCMSLDMFTAEFGESSTRTT